MSTATSYQIRWYTYESIRGKLVGIAIARDRMRVVRTLSGHSGAVTRSEHVHRLTYRLA